MQSWIHYEIICDVPERNKTANIFVFKLIVFNQSWILFSAKDSEKGAGLWKASSRENRIT